MNLIKTDYFNMPGNCRGMCFPVNLQLGSGNTVSFDDSISRMAASMWPQFVDNFKFQLQCKLTTPQIVHIIKGTHIVTFPVQYAPKESYNETLARQSAENVLLIMNALSINSMCIPNFPNTNIFDNVIQPILVNVFEEDPRINIIEHHKGWE